MLWKFFLRDEERGGASSFTTLIYSKIIALQREGEKTWADQVTIYTQRNGWLISVADSEKER